MDALTQRETLVFFAADPGYAFPMLAAARSFREHGRCDESDVTVFAIDTPAAQMDVMRALAAPWRVAVEPLDSADFLGPGADGVRSEDPEFQHLTGASLARLAIGRVIPDRYRQALYIDGDTLCTGDLRPLVESRAAPGLLYGSPDPLNFYKRNLGGAGSATRAYFAGLGLPLDATYYSSGVLLGDLHAWREIGSAALAFFNAHPLACRLLDQSAINAAAHARLRPISLRWNFTTQLRTWGLQGALAPRLMHFAGKAKPWLGPLAPWQDCFAHYESLRADPVWAGLAPPRAPPDRVAADNAGAAHRSLKTMTLDRVRAARVRAAVMAAERVAVF